MHVDAMVARYGELVSNGVGPDERYQRLVRLGAPPNIAQRIDQLVPLVAGRLLLTGTGLALPDRYATFGADGAMTGSGRLEELPEYKAARTEVPKWASLPGFRDLMLESSEVEAVNSALNAGSNPEDLCFGPVAIFDQEPTQAGMAKARGELSRLAREASEAARTRGGSDGRENLARICRYFERCSKADALFAPEATAAQAIARVLDSGIPIASQKSAVTAIIAGVEAHPHHGGSGWADLKLTVRGMLEDGALGRP